MTHITEYGVLNKSYIVEKINCETAYNRTIMAAKAPNPAIAAPPRFTGSAAFVDTTTPPLLIAVAFPDPFVALAPTKLVLVTVLSATLPLDFVAVPFVPAAEVVLLPLELPSREDVFVAVVTLNEFPLSACKPALFTTFTALKFVLVIPNFVRVLRALEFPVVLRSSWV